mgnify:CR=1 FL=1
MRYGVMLKVRRSGIRRYGVLRRYGGPSLKVRSSKKAGGSLPKDTE